MVEMHFVHTVAVKGVVHSNCHELLILMAFQTLKTFVHFRNKLRFEIWAHSDPP